MVSGYFDPFNDDVNSKMIPHLDHPGRTMTEHSNDRPPPAVLPTSPSGDALLSRLAKLVDIPEEEIWLAKQKSKRTRRAYQLDVQYFMRTLHITSHEELRKVDHRVVIAWERINLSVIFRRLLGAGTPREWNNQARILLLFLLGLFTCRQKHDQPCRSMIPRSRLLEPK
jgi:hypothetical protein